MLRLKYVRFAYLLFSSTWILSYSCSSSDIDQNESVIDSRIKTFTINSNTKDEFEKFVNEKRPNPYSYHPGSRELDTFMNTMGEKLRGLLSPDIVSELENMAKDGKPGAILLKELPIDSSIPQDENVLTRVERKTKISESIILGLANVMRCEAKANPREQEGKIIHNVAPVKGFEKTLSSRGKEPLYLHTEEAFEDFPPDFLILYCLEQDLKAGTAYHFIEDILPKFPKEIIEEMKKKQFKIKSNGGALDQPTEGTYALITEESNEKRLRLYGYMEDVTPQNDKAEEVINFINSFFKGLPTPKAVSLKRGEAFIFNNGWGIEEIGGIMHGRNGTIENPQRWLQRAFFHRININ